MIGVHQILSQPHMQPGGVSGNNFSGNVAEVLEESHKLNPELSPC